jgi:Glycosyltransferase family 87
MRTWLWLLLSLFVSATTWVYTHRVLVPWEYHVNVEGGRVIAQLGDLYPRWIGTRALLLRRQNPYSPEVTHEIQIGYYGHPVLQDYGHAGTTPVDEQRFAYPVFVVFLLAPTIHLPFGCIQSGAEVALALLIAASTILWLDFLRWQPSRFTIVAITLFVLTSPQIVQGLRFRQLGLLVGFLLAAAAWCARKNHLANAGMLLAIATIKPQMVLLALLWFLLWAASEWRTRWRLWAGFAGMLVVLVGAGEFLLPGWIGYFLEGVAAYPKYFRIMSLLEVALGTPVGDLVAGMVVCVLLGFAWKHRRQPADSPRFAVMLAAFFLSTTLVMPLLPPFNQVILILPLLLLLREWPTLRSPVRFGLGFCVGWPWIATIAVLLFSHRIHAPSNLALLPSFVTPYVPFILSLLLAARHNSSRAPTVPAP